MKKSSRKFTKELLQIIESGSIDRDTLLRDLVEKFLSEEQVIEFATSFEYFGVEVQ